MHGQVKRIVAVIVLVASVTLLVGQSQPRLAAAQAHPQIGPLDLSGEINGVPFRIMVPATWNGTLIEFVRGFVRDEDARNPTMPPDEIHDKLLAEKYALAGSARKIGWSIEEGLDDVVALVSFFRENVAQPTTTILWGNSVGTVITLETAERNGGAFDGYLTTCGIGAGAPRLWDQALVLQLAYDVTLGMPSSWGTPGDVRDDIDYVTEVAPVLGAQLADAENFGRFEFIRLVAGIPGSGITPPARFYPGALVPVFRAAMEGQAEVERRAGGPVAQNITHTYALTSAEKAYLASLGVNADPFLAAMNARRDIAAPPESRNYLEHFADYSGFIKRPVLTLHAYLDPRVVVAHESAYRDTIAAAGRSDLLMQVYAAAVGHCGENTKERVLTAIQAIEGWARTGTRPAASIFSTELGFIPDFVPPAWPQP
jgi:hypothetical protein